MPRPEHLRGTRHPQPERITRVTVEHLHLEYPTGDLRDLLDAEQLDRIGTAGVEALADFLGDEDRLRGYALASSRLDGMMRAEVASRREQGESWAAVAASLGTSRQAAHERFGTAHP